MPLQDQAASRDDHVSSQQAPTEMRVLTPEELVEIVGGPEVNNGGGGVIFTSNAISSTGG